MGKIKGWTKVSPRKWKHNSIPMRDVMITGPTGDWYSVRGWDQRGARTIPDIPVAGRTISEASKVAVDWMRRNPNG